jgi:hypothetical protein
MKQLFLLDATEQAALRRGETLSIRLGDGRAFAFRFDSGTAPAVAGNGTRPAAGAALDTLTATADHVCPVCGAPQPGGLALATHLRMGHGKSRLEALALMPPDPRMQTRRTRVARRLAAAVVESVARPAPRGAPRNQPKIPCPKCRQPVATGVGMQTHLRIVHKLDRRQRHLLMPLSPRTWDPLGGSRQPRSPGRKRR